MRLPGFPRPDAAPADVEAEITFVEFRGCRFYASDSNKVEAALRRPPDRFGAPRYDRLNFEVIAAVISEGDVCFDVGANVGVYSCVLARLCAAPERVHSFEPARTIRRRLMRNLRLNGFDDVNVNPFGLGAEEAELTFHEVREGTFRGGTSSFVRNPTIEEMGADAFNETVVPVRTLDGYVAEAGLDRLKFMKIDVEGFERAVIEGGRATLERCRPFILMEFDETRHASDAQAFRETFDALGYEVIVPDLTRGRLGFARWDFTGAPRQRNILLVP
jgi:FkbM family methyltransferase